MRIRHTILSFLLLVVIATPLLVLSLLQLKQVYIKQSLEERLEMGLSKSVFISKAKLQHSDGREILIDGKLFDIKTVQKTENGFIVTGVFDDEETAVMQQLNNLCRQKAGNDTPVFAKAFRLLQQLYFQPGAEPPPNATPSRQFFHFPIVHLPHHFNQVPVPPPQHDA